VTGNDGRFVFGGSGGYGWGVNPDGAAGGANTYYFGGQNGLVLTNNVAAQTRPASFGTGSPGCACVSVSNPVNVSVAYLTCFRPGVGGLGTGNGVYISGDLSTPVQVTNSIFYGVTGYALYNATPYSNYLRVSYSAFFGSKQGDLYASQFKEGCLTGKDPLFLNPAAANVELVPSSPCINAGDPSSECSDEPKPNGCRVDMGAYGNTTLSTSAPNAPHCDTCP